jgi:hypothetical protein
MKFMVTWRIHEDKRVEVLQNWASLTPEQRREMAEGVTYIGRWHDMASLTGVLIVETSDAAALFRYLGQWNPALDIEVSPVLDDEESALVSGQIVADLGA